MLYRQLDIDALKLELLSLLCAKKVVIVLIAGNSRSGKSTLSNQLYDDIMKEGYDVQKIELDDWILNVDDRTDDMTVYNRFDSQKIEKDFNLLYKGKIISVFAYEPESRGKIRNLKKYKLNDSGLIIIEGVVALGVELLVKNSDVRIFVDADEDIRKKRFHDFYIDKGLTDSEINHLYQKRMEDEVKLINTTKKHANIIYNSHDF